MTTDGVSFHVVTKLPRRADAGIGVVSTIYLVGGEHQGHADLRRSRPWTSAAHAKVVSNLPVPLHESVFVLGGAMFSPAPFGGTTRVQVDVLDPATAR